MTARVLEGRPVANRIRAELATKIEEFRKLYSIAPTLAVVRVGNDPSNVSYALSIDHAFTDSGMGFQMHVLPEDTTQDQLMARLQELAATDDVHGILLQRPLRPSFEQYAIMDAIPLSKDAEGVTPANMGRVALAQCNCIDPSTPTAALEILKENEIPVEGKRAVVIGRSGILGKPMMLLLSNAGATVDVIHSQTKDVASLTRQAELVFVAVGHPSFLTAPMISPGAVVVDFGVHVQVRGQQNRLVGDVDFDGVKDVAGAVTPVPGGTGPVTTMILMRNTMGLASTQAKLLGAKSKNRWFPTSKSPNRRK